MSRSVLSLGLAKWWFSNFIAPSPFVSWNSSTERNFTPSMIGYPEVRGKRQDKLSLCLLVATIFLKFRASHLGVHSMSPCWAPTLMTGSVGVQLCAQSLSLSRCQHAGHKPDPRDPDFVVLLGADASLHPAWKQVLRSPKAWQPGAWIAAWALPVPSRAVAMSTTMVNQTIVSLASRFIQTEEKWQ